MDRIPGPVWRFVVIYRMEPRENADAPDVWRGTVTEVPEEAECAPRRAAFDDLELLPGILRGFMRRAAPPGGRG